MPAAPGKRAKETGEPLNSLHTHTGSREKSHSYERELASRSLYSSRREKMGAILRGLAPEIPRKNPISTATVTGPAETLINPPPTINNPPINVKNQTHNVTRAKRPATAKSGENPICVELCPLQAQWKSVAPAQLQKSPHQDRMHRNSAANMHKCARKALFLHPYFLRKRHRVNRLWKKRLYPPPLAAPALKWPFSISSPKPLRNGT